MTFTLDLAGQSWEITVPDEEVERFYQPFAKSLQAVAQANAAPRTIILIAAPPGSGKTTLCTILETLVDDFQTLPMDGFHLLNAALAERTILVDGREQPMRPYKGIPESYDLNLLTSKLQALRQGESLCWPRYDRQLHDPVPEAITVNPKGVFLVEGNYFLLDEPGWRDLTPLAHLKVFLEVPEGIVREPTIQRHIRGGRSRREAIAHYERTDLRNRRRIQAHRLPADVILHVDPERRFTPACN